MAKMVGMILLDGLKVVRAVKLPEKKAEAWRIAQRAQGFYPVVLSDGQTETVEAYFEDVFEAAGEKKKA